MRKLFLLSSLLLLCFVVNAQFTSGQKLLGPSFSIGFGNNTDRNSDPQNSLTYFDDRKDQNFSIGIGASILKMKTNSLGFGWGLSYTYLNLKESGTLNQPVTEKYSSNNKSSSFYLNYFRRKFYVLLPKLNFYYDGGIYGSTSSSKLDATRNIYVNPVSVSITSGKQNTYNGGVYATPGFTYKLKSNLLLDASLNNLVTINYSYRKGSIIVTGSTSGSTEFSSSNFGFGSNISATNFLSNITFSLKWIL